VPTQTVVDGLLESAELIYRLAELYYPGDDPDVPYRYDDIYEDKDWKECRDKLDTHQRECR